MARRHQTSSAPHLRLEEFLPYRLSVLSNRISRAVAKLYEDRFDLKLPEWRVMAVIGRRPHITASEIVEFTAMDKVAISRAVKRLVDMGRVSITSDPDDARRQRLALSEDGQAIHDQIVPLALSVEAQLLEDMSDDERAALDRCLVRLSEAAAKLD